MLVGFSVDEADYIFIVQIRQWFDRRSSGKTCTSVLCCAVQWEGYVKVWTTNKHWTWVARRNLDQHQSVRHLLISTASRSVGCHYSHRVAFYMSSAIILYFES